MALSAQRVTLGAHRKMRACVEPAFGVGITVGSRQSSVINGQRPIDYKKPQAEHSGRTLKPGRERESTQLFDFTLLLVL